MPLLWALWVSVGALLIVFGAVSFQHRQQERNGRCTTLCEQVVGYSLDEEEQK